ncbi:Protein of uncharacterised function (DUF535) [Serratia quinivorans]|uniref:Protein of uncharacterized function (DUF535) n=1 Tax=Serratia quinivorans TaxID=137545 RepID=A0A379YIA7_9GAMM|nr:Protein of uncharacterised function (DUF535) [Serratia quinivorans]
MSQLSYPLVSARPLNGWQLMTALANGDKAPSKAWKKTSFRLKFIGRSLLRWPTTSALLNTLASNPLLDEILNAQAQSAVQAASPVSGGEHEQNREPVRPCAIITISANNACR